MSNKIEWPENLIEEIANRRCVIFLGSGISATAKDDKGQGPRIWGEFLEEAVSLTRGDNTFINKMLSQENYTMALQAIHDSCDKGQYARYLRNEYNNPNLNASNIHKYIKEIDSKIVVTTNFDKIYENICNSHGYSVCSYKESEKIISNIKTSDNLIIKAHGTIDDPDNIIFTKRQYYNARMNYSKFYNILKALFLTNTVVFLGYSLNDPDINLILEDVANSGSPSTPHYIVIKEGVDDNIKKHWEESYNISCLEYGPSYDNLDENIEELKDSVLQFREERRIP